MGASFVYDTLLKKAICRRVSLFLGPIALANLLSIYYLSRKNLDLRQVWLLSFNTAIIGLSAVLKVAHELLLRLLGVSTEKEDG